MILGIVLYYLVQKIDGKERMEGTDRAGIVVSVIGGAFVAFHLNKRFMTSSLVAGLAFAWLFLAFWLVRDVFEHRAWKALAFIGIHSFGIYCFHQIIINCVLKVVPRGGPVIWIGSLLLVIMASIGIGFGTEKVQEKLIG
jgi:peptidoglycan/LPS O-acetylase OafA/YrhL